MNIGFVISCPSHPGATADACLEEFDGRSLIGHVSDRVRQVSAALPIVVSCRETADASRLRAYCRRALLPLHAGATATTAGRAVEAAIANGWDAAICLDADQVFVDTDALSHALAVIGTGTFDHVTTHGNGAHPLGTGVDAIRVAAYADVKTDELAGTPGEWFCSTRPDCVRHVLKGSGFAASPFLDLRPATQEGRATVSRVLKDAGNPPAGLKLSEIVGLARGEAPLSPWKGAAGPLMIAEIGGNHEGDFAVAKAMAASAIRSGADCVKFQLYTGATLVSPVESPTRFQHFKKFELEKEQHIYLAEMCREAGLGYVSSVWDEDMLEWIDPYMDFYKVGSGDLTAWPLLRRLAERGKPILLSTGLATVDETMQTVAQIQNVDPRYSRPEWMCVMQCTSMYPIPDGDANLRVMDALRAATGLATGYSDHTIGAEALRVATAMGADVLEFHFTDSREGKEFRDHKVSLVESEVRALREDLIKISELRGSHVKIPQESELSEKHEISFRRGVYLNRDAEAGEVVREADLAVLRPTHGTDARDASEVVGRRLLKDVRAFAAIAEGEHY